MRGTLTHALLQHLPGLDSATWEGAANRFVRSRGAALSQRVRDSIVAETLALLRRSDFAPLFGPSGQAEVPIVAEIEVPGGKGRKLRLTGQIDRLVRLGHEVLIVDYKTNRPPPRRAEDVAEAYTLQLAAYRLAVRQIFPRRCECGLPCFGQMALTSWRFRLICSMPSRRGCSRWRPSTLTLEGALPTFRLTFDPAPDGPFQETHCK